MNEDDVPSRATGDALRRLDPITFELMHAQLLSTVEEMGALLKRSSFSPIIREMNDFSCAVFDPGGDLVAQADFMPAQTGAMSLVVKSTIDVWGELIQPGDAFIANHPYMGCMHTPDINILVPVFIDDVLIAWTGATAHHIDVGGVNPGTEGPALGELYAEGLVLPPIRLYVAGEENPDLFAVIRNNVRDSKTAIADLRAQRASCMLGQRRVVEAVDRYGVELLGALFAEALDHVESAARLALSDFPDAEGEAEGYLDDDGRDGPPTRIHARLIKRGDRITVDLSGSAPQVAGALNVPWASTRACVVFLLRALTDPEMATNDGILRVVDIVCPPGTVLNPNPPAAVSVRHNTTQRVAEVLMRAASSMWPEFAVASSSVAFFDVNLDSWSPKTGRASVMMDVVGGGTGACRSGDGLDGVDTYMSNVALLPTEVAETEYSVRIRRSELVAGSQGRGQYNGGMGLRREYEILDFTQVATVYGEQVDPRYPARGALGGGNGAPTTIEIFDPDGHRLEVPRKVTLALAPGSIIRVETSGGGGFGGSDLRDPELSAADLADGMLDAGL